MNMLLKCLLILIVAVPAGKGKGKGGGRRGGDRGKKNKGDKKSDMCRELRTTNPTKVQDDMTDLLKALIPVSTTEGETTEAPAVMYCGVRSRGYPFVDVPKTEDTTQTPQQRRFLRKKSPVSFKVEGGEVVSGLVKGCDDDTYCFDNVQVSLTASADFTLALRRNLQDETATSEEPTTTETPTSATVIVTSTNPDETITMTYTCDVAYESGTDAAGADTCTPKGLSCRTKYRLAADTDDRKDRRAKMMCRSTMSTDDADLQTAVDNCPAVQTTA